MIKINFKKSVFVILFTNILLSILFIAMQTCLAKMLFLGIYFIDCILIGIIITLIAIELISLIMNIWADLVFPILSISRVHQQLNSISFKLMETMFSVNTRTLNKYKRYLQVYLHNDGILFESITDIEVFQIFNNVKIKITTTRPGVLVGPKGKTIDDLTNDLNEKFSNKNVKILVFEDRLWMGLHNLK